MDTHLAAPFRGTAAGQEAEAILRKCVHCGFCNATCPTYQIFGDELDGPRGRIYLIKQVLEGARPTARTQLHLDRCLTCRACETTCPSGVHYSRLLEVGREAVEGRVGREPADGLARSLLRAVLPRPELFATALGLSRALSPLLPARLHAPAVGPPGRLPAPARPRRMILLEGCVQPALAPNVNGAARRVLDRLGISLVAAGGCCGAVSQHLAAAGEARDQARRNIDAWWPLLEAGAEAVVATASACGVQLRDYGHLLRDDPAYAAKAERVALLARDVSQVVAAEGARLPALLPPAEPVTVAFHSPCTLQHGLQLRGVAEGLLEAAGYRLAPVADGHLCCGSAGTYSLLFPLIATRLRDGRLAGLTGPGAAAGRPPTAIASANAACIRHLQTGTGLPVRHWIELLDARMAPLE